MNTNHCEKSEDNKHTMVYSTRPVWGGGHNIVCAYCKEVFGFSKDEDQVFLAETNNLAQEGKLS